MAFDIRLKRLSESLGPLKRPETLQAPPEQSFPPKVSWVHLSLPEGLRSPLRSFRGYLRLYEAFLRPSEVMTDV